MPRLLVEYFGKYVYHVIGITETIKGFDYFPLSLSAHISHFQSSRSGRILAFVSSPLFGKLSDKFGRKSCLFVTVLGTLSPVCVLAFTTDIRVFAVMQVFFKLKCSPSPIESRM
jgi:MFS family permease